MEKVLENNTVKLLWDFKIQTDRVIEHTKPEILILEKVKEKCVMIDVACPFDTRVKEKVNEKINKYQDLKREIKSVEMQRSGHCTNYHRKSGNCERKIIRLKNLGLEHCFETEKGSGHLKPRFLLKAMLMLT